MRLDTYHSYLVLLSSSELVAHIRGFYLYLDHFQCPSDNSTYDIRVVQVLQMRRKLNKISERAVAIHYAECGIGIPVGGLCIDVQKHLKCNFANHLRDVSIGFARIPAGLRFRKEFVDQPNTDIVTHLLELGVYGIYLLVVLHDLGDQASVCQGEELRIHLLRILPKVLSLGLVV